MKNYFDVFKHLIQQLLVGHTAVDEIEVTTNLLDVFTVTSRQVVEYANTHGAKLGIVTS